MSTFKQLQAQLKETEYKIITAGGEDTDNEYEELTALVKNKAKAVASVLNSKVIESDIKEVDTKIKELQQYKKQLKEKKQWLELQLHNYLQEKGIVEIDTGGVSKYATPSLSVTHEVDKTQLEEDEKLFKVTVNKLSADGFKRLQTWVELILGEITEYKYDLNVGVKDLEPDSKALVEKLRPTVKFTKTLSKGE